MDTLISGEFLPGMDLAEDPSNGQNSACPTNTSQSLLSEVSPGMDSTQTITNDENLDLITSTSGPELPDNFPVVAVTTNTPVLSLIPCLPMEGGIYEGGEYRYRGVDLSTLEVTPAEAIHIPLVDRTVIEALFWAQKRSPESSFPQCTLVEALRNTMRQIGLVKSENLLDHLYQTGVLQYCS